MKTDTIAAIATAMTSSGIGIIRISGPEALEVIEKIFYMPGKRKKALESHRVYYGHIKDGAEIVDEVMVLVMMAPRTYTREDTVEIDCHGGILVMQKILDTVLRNGARLAEPGEFTKRAFLNGRIDLSQAEAVIGVINAKNEYALKASVDQLNGRVSEKVKRLREDILYQIAFIESALDDPEHISLEGYREQLLKQVLWMKQELRALLDTSENGRVLTEGIKTVILGKPNVGKSSLLNILAGEERAIVTDIAGTTRDILTEHIMLGGISLNITDTAGIRDTDDVIEKIGVDRARENAASADLIIYVVDSSRELDKNDYDIMEFIRDKRAVVLLNKTDLEPVVLCGRLKEVSGKQVIPVSAREDRGLGELEAAVKDMFLSGQLTYNDQVCITNMRQKEAVREAWESIAMVHRSIEDNMPEDFYTIDLMNAYEQLGHVVGEAVEDDLVNEIFEKFCMGK